MLVVIIHEFIVITIMQNNAFLGGHGINLLPGLICTGYLAGVFLALFYEYALCMILDGIKLSIKTTL